jgi:hypothetical protein
VEVAGEATIDVGVFVVVVNELFVDDSLCDNGAVDIIVVENSSFVDVSGALADVAAVIGVEIVDFTVDTLEGSRVAVVGAALVDVNVSVDVVNELVVEDSLRDLGSVDEMINVE